MQEKREEEEEEMTGKKGGGVEENGGGGESDPRTETSGNEFFSFGEEKSSFLNHILMEN